MEKIADETTTISSGQPLLSGVFPTPHPIAIRETLSSFGLLSRWLEGRDSVQTEESLPHSPVIV